MSQQQYYQVQIQSLEDFQKNYPNFQLVGSQDDYSGNQHQQIVVAHDPNDLIIQEDTTNNIVYSPQKQNETQYVMQDENGYSIQAQQQAAQQQQQQQQQQIYYNIPNDHQHNVMPQHQHVIVQQTPKVVVQRQPDFSQPHTMQIQNQQGVQQQQQQYVTYQQQPAPSISYQQTSPQQVQQFQQVQQVQEVHPQFMNMQTMQQQQRIQQTLNQIPLNNVIKINANQNLYIRPQIQNQQGGSQQPVDGQMQRSNTVSFRPRGPQQQTYRVVSNPMQNKIRIPTPRLATASPRKIVAPQQQTQQVNNNIVINNSNVNRIIFQQQSPQSPNPSGGQYIVNNNQLQQISSSVGQQQQYVQQIKTPPRQPKSVQMQTSTPYQNQTTLIVKKETPNSSPIQVPPPLVKVSEQPTTTTLPCKKKDVDFDDLEDSIEATVVSRAQSSSAEQHNSTQMNSISMDDYRRRQVQLNDQTPQRNQNVGVVRPMIKPQTNQIMQPRQQTQNQMPYRRALYQAQQPGMNQNRPPQLLQSQRTTGPMQHQQNLIEVRERESAKMLVILENGEQRLITFTLPKETCTVQELLEQVNIRVEPQQDIECISNPGGSIDYIVKVGRNKHHGMEAAATIKAAENVLRHQEQLKQQQLQQSKISSSNMQQPEVIKTPEPPKVPEKLVNGFLALCTQCGYTGYDHAKCQRCHRVFTEEPKKIKIDEAVHKPSLHHGTMQQGQTTIAVVRTIQPNSIGVLVARTPEKKDQMEMIQKKHQMAQNEQKKGMILAQRVKAGQPGQSRPKPRARPTKVEEPVIVMLSSDDEEEDSTDKINNASTVTNNSVKKPSAPLTFKVYNPLACEPVIEDDTGANELEREDVTDLTNSVDKIKTEIKCRTIRIGSLKYESTEPVVFTTKGIRIVAPNARNNKENTILNIHTTELVKIVYHFSKQIQAIFIYTKPSCAVFVRNSLEMGTSESDKIPYFHPMSRLETCKKIVLITGIVDKDKIQVLVSIFAMPLMEEITSRDANELLMRSTQNNQMAATALNATNSSQGDPNNASQADIKQILIYPPGRGGLSINTEDYMCLATDQYLNDVIIDFYLKYFYLEHLKEEEREKTHIFSTFFYKRLTTMPSRSRPDKDAAKQTAAQKRHSRVKNWTKNVNIFEKDYIVIPINEQSHWFLAIICFPHLKDAVTMDGEQPIKLLPARKRKLMKDKKAAQTSQVSQIGNTTITPAVRTVESINLGDDELSERDEAEGDDSELGSDDDSDDDASLDRGQAVKRACILIFDSLPGASRARVVATLRDYVACEFKAKSAPEVVRVFNKDSMPGCCVKSPVQTNFTDCGLYLLHSVEQFYNDPIKDFRIPIKNMTNWFPSIVVTRKREELSNLLQTLIKREKPEGLELPEIELPTKNGLVIPTEDSIENAFDEDYEPDEELEELEEGQVPTKINTTSKLKAFDSSKESSSSSQEPSSPAKKIVLKKRVAEKDPNANRSPKAQKLN